MNDNKPFWGTFWTTYGTVQLVGTALAVCYVAVPSPAPLTASEVIMFGVPLCLVVTFLPTMLFATAISCTAQRLVPRGHGLLLHTSGLVGTTSLFYGSATLLMILGDGFEFDGLSGGWPFLLIALAASLSGTAAAQLTVTGRAAVEAQQEPEP